MNTAVSRHVITAMLRLIFTNALIAAILESVLKELRQKSKDMEQDRCSAAASNTMLGV